MVSYIYMTIIRTLALLLALLIAAPTYAASLSVHTLPTEKPTCEVRATKKSMTSGSTVDIAWTSKNATHMTGLVRDAKVRPVKGREHIAIAVLGKHTFPLTFTGPGGKITCSASVFVHPKKSR